ncbi:Nitronate monooxygenase-domain-containing protein [Aspergillus spectabilis]
MQVWIHIGTVGEARGLVGSPEKPDVVVVQGSEFGGDGRVKDGMGLISLLPEVGYVMAGSGIPLVAAGGIAAGRGLGAEGVVMGTRFLASREARTSPGDQNEIVRADEGAVSTTHTLLYKHLRGIMGGLKITALGRLLISIMWRSRAGHSRSCRSSGSRLVTRRIWLGA